MSLAEKIKNGWRRLVQSWGTPSMKRRLWNREFDGGRWDHLAETPGDCVYPIVERHLHGGAILDLGCGSGNTANELRSEAYSSYTGVDISDIAVNKAIARSVANGRADRSRFVQCDITTYEPDCKFSVILFRESINYVPVTNIVRLLKRYRKHLASDGVFVVRLYDRMRHKPIHELIRGEFELAEEFMPDDSPTVVLVFR